MSDYPEPNELVVCRIKSLKSYGAFVDLLEYNKEGFIHISQISSGWIKNIRSHVSEGQIRVAQVTNIDREKGIIDVSLRKVSESQERRRMSEYKRTKRANKMFEYVAKELGEDLVKARKEIVDPLIDKYGDLFSAFEAMSAHGQDALDEVKIPKKWADALVKFSKENVTPPQVTITRKLMLRSYKPDGINHIRSALEKLEKYGVTVSYVSAPYYSASVTAEDYHEAETILQNSIDDVEKTFKKHGEITIERVQK